MSPLRFLREDIANLKPYKWERPSGLIRMDANENPFDAPRELKRELAVALMKLPFNRYPDGSCRQLKEALSERAGVDPDQIAVGNGSDELIGHIITIFSSPKAKVIYPVPTFSMYGIIARSMGVRVGEVPLTERFEIDLEGMEREMDGEPNIVFISYPNNPTGNCFEKSAILKLMERDDAIVVVDEAYYEFSGKTFLNMLDRFENLIILRTLSKAYGLAGLRVGYMIARAEVVEQVDKVRLPYNLNSFSQLAALKALQFVHDYAEQIKLIIEERERVFEEMRRMEGVHPFPSEANFILFRVRDAGACFEGLMRRGVLVRNLSSPGPLEGCLRVTISTPHQNDRFLEALRSCVAGEA